MVIRVRQSTYRSVYSDLIPEVSLRPKYTLTHDHHGMTAEQRTDLWTVWSLNNTCKQLVAVDEVVQQLKLLNGIINKYILKF